MPKCPIHPNVSLEDISKNRCVIGFKMDNSFVIKGFSDNRSIWQYEYKFIVAAVAGSDERDSITTDSAAVNIFV